MTGHDQGGYAIEHATLTEQPTLVVRGTIPPTQIPAFMGGAFARVSEVARADGPVVQLEIRVIKEFFEERLQFNELAMDSVRLKLKEDIDAPEQDIEFLTTRARSAVKPQMRIEVVRSLYDLGLVDGQLTRAEQDTLKRIVGLFNLSDEQLQLITAEYFGQGDKEYELLGLTKEATEDELKSAWRKLAAEHHPDRAKDNGEKFRAIKDAYEAIKKQRGF